jgi:nucleoside-diphosphate-sugar epimerase
VTGSAGRIGREQVRVLREAGYDLRTFDRQARGKDEDWEHISGDLRDIYTVRRAVEDMEAVVHLGAIPHDTGNDEEVLSINVQGTWNVLLACAEAGVARVVYFSSVNALGCVGGYRPAQYLPIDDDYPRHPFSAYQISKHLGEEMCRAFSNRHGLITVALRPVFVTNPRHSARYRNWGFHTRPDRLPEEYWAYVDVRDVCDATLCSLSLETTHDAFLLTADDTTQETPTAELVEKFYPDTPWKTDRDAYLAGNSHRSLFDCSHAKQQLGWQPKHSWRDGE